jgi:hypothetical protein
MREKVNIPLPKYHAMKTYMAHIDKDSFILDGGIPAPAALSPEVRATSSLRS